MKNYLTNKKVLIFIQNGLGGAERVQIEIAKMLLKQNFTVEFCIISPHNWIDNISQYFPKPCQYNIIYSTHFRFDILKKLYKVIKRSRPGFIFSSAMHLNQRILLLKPFFSKIKFIVRNENYISTLPNIKKHTLHLTYIFADIVITQTEEMTSKLLKLGIKDSKIITLHNPINHEEILKNSSQKSPYPESSDIIYVAVGRISRQKGFDILIKAFSIVNKNISNSKLYIVGNTEYEDGKVFHQLIQLVKDLGLDNKVIFTGHLSNPYPYVKYANVFVLSSRNEGLPNALIESQALHKPCAATDCIPIISRIVIEGKNGYVARTEDPESLSEAMLKCLTLTYHPSPYKPAQPSMFTDLFSRSCKKE